MHTFAEQDGQTGKITRAGPNFFVSGRHIEQDQGSQPIQRSSLACGFPVYFLLSRIFVRVILLLTPSCFSYNK